MGQHVVGSLHSYGMKDIYNLEADAEVQVWIEEFMLDKDEALESAVRRVRVGGAYDGR